MKRQGSDFGLDQERGPERERERYKHDEEAGDDGLPAVVAPFKPKAIDQYPTILPTSHFLLRFASLLPRIINPKQNDRDKDE